VRAPSTPEEGALLLSGLFAHIADFFAQGAKYDLFI
jgi:hypothetical protein